MWQSIGLTLLVIVATLACVLLFMLCGNHLQWKKVLFQLKEQVTSRTAGEPGKHTDLNNYNAPGSKENPLGSLVRLLLFSSTKADRWGAC
ncbi:small integral membrane protein 13 isoform X7 [Cuculus canorus]|uniref:small integral membrane protein 13 isoform X7 n=1 Tax=Cuculus canorus TaxID=55661 RepID=UPI0023AB194C|nr:small integral membrane protein 13 isoform X7 [Cuculus canorus]